MVNDANYWCSMRIRRPKEFFFTNYGKAKHHWRNSKHAVPVLSYVRYYGRIQNYTLKCCRSVPLSFIFLLVAPSSCPFLLLH